MKIAALYIDPQGPYPKMADVDCWDEKRDAKKYDGPWPVVAHPPCGPWGRLKFLNKHQDPSCGPRAVEQVRKFGGVLEHPEHSTLWKRCALPRPGELRDAWGGYTVRVNQCDYGHRCKKATWLYFVGVHANDVVGSMRFGGKPTHRVTNGSRGDTSLPRIGALEARLTPPLFAEWLISLARSCKLHAPAPVTLQSQNDANEQSRTNEDDKVQPKGYRWCRKCKQYHLAKEQNCGGSNPLAPTSETVGVSPKKGPEQ